MTVWRQMEGGGTGAMGGGGAETRFKPGSREEWLYKVTRVSAIVWIVCVLVVAVLTYRAAG